MYYFSNNEKEVSKMIVIKKDMEMPKECHECPFQIQFKNGYEDEWYMRRCVIENRVIEYPRPEWCPLHVVRKEASADG